ncbi:MAG: hypothetical protein V2B15_16570 [Bacteroidota bacterium]
MERLIFILSTGLLLCFVPYTHAQTPARISDPELQLIGDKVQIRYRIINSTQEDRYRVRIEISNADGYIVAAYALSGDIGEHVSGGGEKTILWDMKEDGVELKEFFVTVFALPEIALEPENTPPVRENLNEEAPPPGFSRTGLMLQSLFLPGLGLSRYRGGPHWIKGLAGYGCIAGAVGFNAMARSTYEAYEVQISVQHADEQFNKSKTQDNISEGLAYAAVVIWISDLVWTYVGTSDLNHGPGSRAGKGLSMGALVDPQLAVPLLSFRYVF